MSNLIVPFSEGGNLSRDARRAVRAISRHHAGAQIRITAVDVETDVAIAKLDAVTMATGSGMTSIVRVAQAQKQLEMLAPEAAGRLAFLADAHLLAVGDIVQDLRRDLRRR